MSCKLTLKKFLITVCEPLQLTMQTPVKNVSENELGQALQGQLGLLRERGFIPTVVYVDPESAFRALRTQFPGVVIDVGGTKDYVAKVDAKIRRVKEAYRAVKSGLAWKLPTSRVNDLVAYVVSRLNVRRTTALCSNVCPRVLFTGVKPNFKKEFGLSFGEYVEVHAGTTNTSKERSIPCIAMYPCGNATGSWNFWSLTTGQTLRRSTWTKMVTTDLVTSTVNTYAEDEDLEARRNIDRENNFIPEVTAETDTEAVDSAPATTSEQIEEENVLSNDANDEENTSDDNEAEPDIVMPEPEVEVRRSGRIAAGVKPPERLTLHSKLSQQSWQEQETKQAIEGELKQLFEELEALKLVKDEDIPPDTKVLRSHMFVVEKLKADGSFDKVKARLVADGRGQDPELYPDKASPTIAVHSVFTILAICTGYNVLKMAKIDIKGAFVQTPMKGPPVYMTIEPKIVKYVLQMYPFYKSFVRENGSMLTKLNKAMYGCVQSSKLWFDLLTVVLRGEGYEHSPTDACVMMKVVGAMRFYIMIYVDDLLILASLAEIERLRDVLIDRFKTITIEIEENLSYLGMQIIRKTTSTAIDMAYYTEKVVAEAGAAALRSVPGKRNTFAVNEQSEKLSEKDREWFHSVTAKILYLAKRARPDVLTVVSYLCTRVTMATKEDKVKLQYLIGYLKQTSRRQLVFRPNNNLQLQVYIDASYALHADAKSHTGVVIFANGVPVYVASRKQKCMTKSPTEAELVGLTDNLGLVELFQEFWCFINNNKNIAKPLIHQDSTSVLTLVTKGGGVTRTKHMRARVFLAKESIDEKRFMVTHCKAEDMHADGASKPLEGNKFNKYAAIVQGEMSIDG